MAGRLKKKKQTDIERQAVHIEQTLRKSGEKKKKKCLNPKEEDFLREKNSV